MSRRGEFVKSAVSTLEAPIVRAIRRDFAAVSGGSDFDATVAPEMYGKSVESHATGESDDGFAAAVAQARSRSNPKAAKHEAQWRPVILQVILDEIIVPCRSERLDNPNGGYFRREVKQAGEMNARWAEARLNGLDCADAEVIEWIRLSAGERPNLATELFQGGISPKEARLQLGYGGRVDPRRPTLYERFRDGHMNRSEVIAAVRDWRRNTAVG